MAGNNLRLALQIQADLNQARQAVRSLGTDLTNTSENASDATQQLEQSLDSAIREIQRLSGATDMQQGINELRQYEQQLENTADATDTAAESNQFLSNSVQNLMPHLMSLAGISGGFVAIAVDTLNKAIELDRLASFSTTGVEQFQYYAAGAKSVGIEVEDLAQIFKDARDKVGDFMAEGGGELQDFFENIAPKVGVTAEQFKKLTGPEIMQLYVNTLREAGVSENEMITHMERIADDATVLLPLLEENGKGFKKYGDAAKATGAILDEDVVKQAKTAKEALGQFQNEVTGITYKLVANAAPAIVFVAQNLDVLAKAGLIVASIWAGKVVSSVIATTIAFVAGRIEAIRYQMALASMAGIATTTATRLTALSVVSSLLTGAGGLLGLGIAAAGVAASFLLLDSSSDTAIDGLENQKVSVAELAEEYRKLDESQQRIALREAVTKQEELTESYDKQREKLENLAKVGIKAYGVSDEHRMKAEKLIEQFQKGQISANQLATEYQKLTTVQESLRNNLDEVATSTKQAKEQQERQNIIVDAYTGKASEASITTYDLNNKIEDTGTKAKSAAGEIGHLSQAWKDYIKSAKENIFSTTMENSLLQKGYSESLAKGLTDARVAKGENLTAQDTQLVMSQVNVEEKISDFKEKQKKQEEAITKEQEKQVKLAETQKIISATSNEQTKKMLMVYQAFTKAGLTDPIARYFTAEIGREGSYLDENLFGSHKDQNNGYTNSGMLSWQKTRSKDLMAFLQSKGVLDSNGNIEKTQEALDAQALNLVRELFTDRTYKTSKNAVLGNASYKDLQQIIGHNFTGWDIRGSKLSDSAVSKNIKRMDGYKSQLDALLGSDPNEALSVLSKMTQVQTDFQHVQEQQDKNRLSLRESLWTEEEKNYQDHVKKLSEIEKAGFSDTEKNDLIVKENKRYEDALSKRPEILKRVQDSLSSLNESWLRASDHDLAADLNAVDEKWKQPKADLASLMMSEPNAVQANQYQEMLVKIDFVIDKEKLTLQFNDAMKQLEELQSLRSQRQDTLKVQYDSGQISRYQYADGLRSIDTEMKPQMQGLIDLAGQLAEKMGDAFNVERIKSMNAELNQSDKELSKFLPTADQVIERIASGMTDAIMAWADGTKSASQAFKEFASSFLREIAQMILKQIIFNALKSLTGYSDGGLVTGFSSGGYTGAGGKYDPAGVVHKDEFVIRKESTNQAGAKEFLSYFNRYGMDALNKFKGYADGGLVAAPQVNLPNIPTPKVANPAEQIANSTSFSANQNFYLVDDPARILDVLKSGASQENLVVMMSRDPAKFKAALKLG